MFHQLLLAAVHDGKLSEKEMEVLASKRAEYGLTEDDVRPIRAQLYLLAFEAVTRDEEVTAAEWKEMLKIQQFLGIDDAEVARTKKELWRLHILSEVRSGNMPIVRVRDLLLQKRERVYWRELAWLAEKGRKVSGELLLTSKRIVFRGRQKSIAAPLAKILHVKVFGDHVVYSTGKRVEVWFEPVNGKIVEGIVTYMMNQ